MDAISQCYQTDSREVQLSLNYLFSCSDSGHLHKGETKTQTLVVFRDSYCISHCNKNCVATFVSDYDNQSKATVSNLKPQHRESPDITENIQLGPFHGARHTLNGINGAPLNGSVPSVYVKWSGRKEGE